MEENKKCSVQMETK